MENDGGQAFPSVHDAGAGIPIVHPGMSLRDWFAGMALQTLIDGWAGCDSKHATTTAVVAYQFADAMLAERAKG